MSSYDQWTEAAAIIKHNHFGLLRDRIKRSLHINLCSNDVTQICSSSTIDKDTFTMFYNRYQSYFDNTDCLMNAVKAGNLPVVQILLEQTKPVVFKREVELMKEAIERGHYYVVKYLWDLETPSHRAELERRYKYLVKRVLAKRSSNTIRLMLEPNSFTKDLADKYLTYSLQRPQDIILTEDQQLIESLLPDIATSINDGEPIPSMMSRLGQQAEKLIAQLRLMCSSCSIDTDGLNDIASSLLEKSIKDTTSLQQQHHVPVQSQSTLDDGTRLAFIKIGELSTIIKAKTVLKKKIDRAKYQTFFLDDYIRSGDSHLIPYLIDRNIAKHYRVFNSIVKYGCVEQAHLAIKHITSNVNPGAPLKRLPTTLYQSFLDAHDHNKSLKVIIYLNSMGITVKKNIDRRMFNGTMDMLQFLLSDGNKIFPLNRLSLFVFDGKQLEYSMSTKPNLIKRESIKFIAKLAAMNDNTDIIQVLRQRTPNLLTHCFLSRYSLLNGGPHLSVFKLLTEAKFLFSIDPTACKGKFEELIQTAIQDYSRVGPLDCVLEWSDKLDVKSHVLTTILPTKTKMLINRHEVQMLQHLLDIGAVFDTKGVHMMEAYKSNPSIQSIIAEYRLRNYENKKRSMDKQTTSTKPTKVTKN
ncbi:hypothetical protein SAMD00019534_068540 [Acytostelium subglobosum LB1]|uniref:hypothetical protein n=1 Tax=Acytostelium subglobosum LB1 TaxID=1410327 RepID=UPI00064493B6|nr:hypothetical protein SAMD00019534_068540 [Acytostelium subglobosum LB1]GAM23679.1 hypothetical protein SAMD00019534_068540 [Acytostelium subglobosum LB1]|eukprot:XP_012753420.1 hypothetical protein SAMD00019534_068540 [Acytostelium subglobosum LB1]